MHTLYNLLRVYPGDGELPEAVYISYLGLVLPCLAPLSLYNQIAASTQFILCGDHYAASPRGNYLVEREND